MLRQPIVTIMGHVDHGKTSILDAIRGSAVAAKEAGGITQAIGASIIPLGTIESVCGPLLKTLGLVLTIPGLLFIDTPGHAAFVNLRKRGGNLADIAILVVDIMDGLKPQTLESIEVLRSYKIPFVIAANKIDLIQGWTKSKGSLLAELQSQSPSTQAIFDQYLYTLVGKIYDIGLQTERFDRVSDYTKQLAIVPVSARTNSGIPELVMTIAGLAQKFLEKRLETCTDAQGKGTILEVKEHKGVGKVMDVIMYSGAIHVGDTLVIGTASDPKVTTVKALFLPEPLAEMREKKSSFTSVKSAQSATGVRVVAHDMEDIISGMPVVVVKEGIDQALSQVQEQVQEVIIETEDEGIIIKADSLGSLEALSYLLKERKIPVKKASVGEITKRDIADAEALAQKDILYGVILGFSIPPIDIDPGRIKVIVNTVIYRLIDDYEEWKRKTLAGAQLQSMDHLIKPCKITLLKGYVFRQSNPAVVGVEVIAGTLHSNTPLMTVQGKELTIVKGIQFEQKNVDRAEKNKQVAVSLPHVTIGRQLQEGDVLYSSISEDHFRAYKDLKEFLSADEREVLREIATMKRDENPVWGI